MFIKDQSQSPHWPLLPIAARKQFVWVVLGLLPLPAEQYGSACTAAGLRLGTAPQ